MKDTIITFTSNSLQEIKTNGCDQAWVLNKDRAEACKYLLCCHSQGNKRKNAFLIGLISTVTHVYVDSNSGNDPWAINIYEYASLDIPNVWGGWENPVHYSSLEDLKIDISSLKFEKIEKNNNDIPPLTLEQAKQGLAKTFKVKIEQIDIFIRG